VTSAQGGSLAVGRLAGGRNQIRDTLAVN